MAVFCIYDDFESDAAVFATLRIVYPDGDFPHVIDPDSGDDFALLSVLADRVQEDPEAVMTWMTEHAPEAVIWTNMLGRGPDGYSATMVAIGIDDPMAALAFKARFHAQEIPW